MWKSNHLIVTAILTASNLRMLMQGHFAERNQNYCQNYINLVEKWQYLDIYLGLI